MSRTCELHGVEECFCLQRKDLEQRADENDRMWVNAIASALGLDPEKMGRTPSMAAFAVTQAVNMPLDVLHRWIVSHNTTMESAASVQDWRTAEEANDKRLALLTVLDDIQGKERDAGRYTP